MAIKTITGLRVVFAWRWINVYVWNTMFKGVNWPVPNFWIDTAGFPYCIQICTQHTSNVGREKYEYVPHAVEVGEVKRAPEAAVESVT